MWKRVIAGAAGAALLVAGCPYNWQRGVSQAASIEHGCPMERVAVVSDNGDGYARLVELDVCGARRVYHDVGGRNGYVWVDTTPTSGGDASEASASRGGGERRGSARGRAADAIATMVRERVTAARNGVLACAGTDSAAVLAFRDAGEDRVHFGLRGDDSLAVADCLDLAIGEVLVDPAQPAWELLHPLSR